MNPRTFDLDPATRSRDPDYLDCKDESSRKWMVFLDGEPQEFVIQARASKGGGKGCVVRFTTRTYDWAKKDWVLGGRTMLWGFVEFREDPTFKK